MQSNIDTYYKGKKILVTGGAGFIGSNLCDALLNLGASVVCLDNLSNGFERNISHLDGDINFRFINASFNDTSILDDIMSEVNIVFHQGALGSVPRSIKTPLITNKSNVTGQLNVLDSARRNDIERVVYASSSSVYGDSKNSPKIEHIIGKQLSPYAVTKHINELYGSVFHRLYGLKTIGLRYFNVFGQRQDPDGAYAAAIPKFIKAFMKGESPKIHGDGEQSRDFTFIENVIQANLLAGSTTNENAFGEAFNIAYGEKISINELISVLQSLLSEYYPKVMAVKPEYIEERVGDVRESLANISKSSEVLGYNPEFNLHAGLSKAIKWYVKSFAGQVNS